MEDLILSFFPSYYAYAKTLGDVERLAFYDAMFGFFFEGVEPDSSCPAYSAFQLIRPNIENSKRRKMMGRKGGQARGEHKARFGNQNARKNASVKRGEDTSANRKLVGVGVGVGEGMKKATIPQNPPSAGFDAATAFDEFWAAYPSNCPRKTDKKKCGEKYARLMRDAKDPAALHSAILGGLSVWRQCETWTRDNGQYIRAPLVWLNNENWNDTPGGDMPDGDDGSGAMSETEAVLERLRREREQERTAQ